MRFLPAACQALTRFALVAIFASLIPPVFARSDVEIEVVNPFPAAGPVDISGSMPFNKVLRAMQSHAMPPVTDALAREIHGVLTVSTDARVVIRRQARENGMEALRYVTNAGRNRRAVLLGSTGSIVIQPLVAGEKPHIAPGLQPVVLVASMPFLLVGSAGSQPDLRTVLQQAREKRMRVASAGEFTISHLVAALLEQAAGIRAHQVTFNGTAAAARAIVTGEADMAVLPLPGALSYAGNPRIRALAVTTASRHEALPGVPTLLEAGIPGATYSAWYGLFIAAASASHVVDGIYSAMAPELSAPTWREWLIRQGLAPGSSTPYGLQDAIQKDIERWKPYIEQLRIR